MIRHLLLLLLSCFLSVGLKAQDVPNTLVIHLAGGVDEVRVPVDEVDSLFLEVEEEAIYLRQTDGSLHGYPLVGVSYMDFTSEEHSPYQSVDLGLSVEWATFNVGASQPEDYGDLFAWGETTPKTDYSESAYLYYHNYEYDYIGVNICGTKYDAATACWGGEWRMPVLSEVRELTDRCTWTADTLNGVSGYKVTGPNGNSIFLPRAGYQTSTERQSAGHDGYYWCGSLNRSKPSSAYNLNFSGYAAEWSANRSMGFSIRAVRPKKNDGKQVDVIIFMGQSNMAGRGIVTDTHPEDAPSVIDGAGYEFRAISDPTKLYPITKTFGLNENVTDAIDDRSMKTGGSVPAFINDYFKKTLTPVIGVSASKGGTSSNNWQPSGSLLPDAINRLTTCVTWLETNGYTIRHKYMVWCQGESDGDNGVSAANYITRFSNIFNAMKAEGIEKCFMIQIGNYNGSTAGLAEKYEVIQGAQEDICTSNDDVIMVSDSFRLMQARGLMKDQFHYYQDGYNIVGRQAGYNAGIYRNMSNINKF